MFNFDSLEWMDVDSMNAAIQLEYDSLMKNCTALIADITNRIRNKLDKCRITIQIDRRWKAGFNKLAGVACIATILMPHKELCR